jgi:hypothetical protein
MIVSVVKNLIYATTAIAFGFIFSFFLNSGSSVRDFVCVGMALMGFTCLWELFYRNYSTNVRYSGTSLTFNMAGIISIANDCDLAVIIV